MSSPINLSPVEQALVSEIAAWFERASAELKVSADNRLSVILQAHDLLGKECKFSRTDSGWVLIPPAEAQDAPQEGIVE